IAGEGDPPEPAGREDEKPDQTLVASLPSRRGLEVRKEGDLAEARDGLAATDTAGGEEAVAPARVDHETGAQAPRVPPLTDVHRGSGRVELDLLDEGGLEQGDPRPSPRLLPPHPIHPPPPPP